ncbi:hypothetical protein ABCS02_17475 [Microbacterium sp. X-17]|uniref:hypothetical protein n=1 Tax=Microbacterium sp. X-17 TaxID=3144404 RepID=UPI0031F5D507
MTTATAATIDHRRWISRRLSTTAPQGGKNNRGNVSGMTFGERLGPGTVEEFATKPRMNGRAMFVKHCHGRVEPHNPSLAHQSPDEVHILAEFH